MYHLEEQGAPEPIGTLPYRIGKYTAIVVDRQVSHLLWEWFGVHWLHAQTYRIVWRSFVAKKEEG